MDFIYADRLSLNFFAILCGITLQSFTFWLYRYSKFQLKTYLLFTAAFSLITLSGLARMYPIPTLPLMLASVFIFGFWFSFSKRSSNIIANTSLTILIGAQCFRFPLELILHRWAEIGTVPQTMTWTGSNWDILAGVAALVFAPFVKRNKVFAWIPQIVGSLLFINLIRVVILSSPFPFSWDLERPLLLAAYFPYALIVPVFVLPAFILHILTFRKLLAV